MESVEVGEDARPACKRLVKVPAALAQSVVTATLGQREGIESSTATTQTMKQKWARQLFYPVVETLLGEC